MLDFSSCMRVTVTDTGLTKEEISCARHIVKADIAKRVCCRRRANYIDWLKYPSIAWAGKRHHCVDSENVPTVLVSKNQVLIVVQYNITYGGLQTSFITKLKKSNDCEITMAVKMVCEEYCQILLPVLVTKTWDRRFDCPDCMLRLISNLKISTTFDAFLRKRKTHRIFLITYSECLTSV